MRFSFWLHLEACGILVPQPGIEPVFPAVQVWSPNHWTAREFPEIYIYIFHIVLKSGVCFILIAHLK